MIWSLKKQKIGATMYFPGLEDAPFKKNMGEICSFFWKFEKRLEQIWLEKIPSFL